MFFDNIPAYSPLYPDAFINPAEKDKNWHLQFVQAAYANHANNQYMTGRFQQWTLNRLFAQGKQPVDRYVSILCGNGARTGQTDGQHVQGGNIAGDKGTNFMNINWRIVSVMPKIRDSVINYVNKIKFRAEFNAMNPEAIEQKKDIKDLMWAEKQLKDYFDDLENIAGFKLSDRQNTDWIPDEYEEFEALAHAKIKVIEEIRAELGCGAVFEENEWKILERRLDESGFDLAFESLECRANKFTGKIDVNYIDPETLLLPSFSGKTGESIWVIGACEWISMYQLYQEAGNQYTPEEYKAIAETFRNRYNNVWDGAFDWNATTQNRWSAWKSFQIPRIRVYWYDTNVKKFTATQKGGGDTTYRWRDWSKPAKNNEYTTPDGATIKNTSDELQSQIVREASWIVGTGFLHNYGKLKDVSRDQMDRRQSFLPIKIYKIADQSRVERAIPYLDNVCLTWYRLQDRIARGIPGGIKINLDSFEKLVIDQKEWSTKNLLELAVQSGIIFYRTTDTMLPENGGQMLPPVEPHEGSGLGILAEYIAAMDSSIQKTKEVTGINDLFDSATPDPKTLKGVAQMSYNSVVNSISELVFARQYLFEKTALDIAGKLQLKALEGDVEMYSQALGTVISIPQKLSTSKLGIKVEAVPTDKDKEEMKAMLAMSLQTTGVPMDFDDLYYINNLIDTCESLKLAERLINVRINKRRAQIGAQQQQTVLLQAQENQKMEMQKAQAAKDMLVYEQQLNMQYEQFLTGEIIKRNAAQSQFRQEQTVTRSNLKDKETTHKALTEQVFPKT